MPDQSFSRPIPSASVLATLRARLQQARHQHQWSQQELAGLLGTTPLNVSRWERGLTTPNPYFRHKLCELFGLSEIELGLRPEPASLREERPDPQMSLSAPYPLIDPMLPLPATVPLVGRAGLLAECKRSLHQTRSIALSALHGLPGVGKTALALELASDPEVRASYPDGLLWAALGPQPRLVSVLSHWGQVLGIQEELAAHLHTPQDWVRTLRATIGSRRLLFVLDDAWDLETALACRVGGSQCAYVLTTRLPQIAQSFALHDAYPVETLEEEAGLDLVQQLAPWAVEQAPESVRALVQAAGGLPLALSLLGHTLCQQTHDRQPRRLHATLQRLQDGLARLQLAPRLVGEQRPLEAVIRSSAEYLSEPARRAWAALSLLPARPHSFGEEAGLAIAQVEVNVLDALSDAGLLEAVGAGRYTFHQVLADYGRAHLSEEEAPAVRRRLIAYGLRYAEQHRKQYAELEEEASVLIAGLESCVYLPAEAELLQLVLTLISFWRTHGDYNQADQWLPQAAAAASHQGMAREEARVRLEQGEISIERGDYEQAYQHYEHGLALAQQVGEPEILCACLRGRSRVANRRGMYEQAEQALREGLALARQYNLLQQQAKLLQTLGVTLESRGDLEASRVCTQEALELAQQVGDYELMCYLLINLGVDSFLRGDLAQAIRFDQEALALARQHGFRYIEGFLLSNLGEDTCLQGNYQQGEQYLQEGLLLVRQLGILDDLCALLRNLGTAMLVQGKYLRAEQYLKEDVDLARQLGHAEDLSQALTVLGEMALAQGKYVQAGQHLQESLGLARQMSAPHYICLALVVCGEVALAQGHERQAEQYLREEVTLARTAGLAILVAPGLKLLGELALAQGDYERTEQWLQEAHSLARQSGNPKRVTEILTDLGALARVRGEQAQAEPFLLEAVQMARMMALPPLLCRILYQQGLLALQRRHLEEAVGNFEEMLATAPEGAVVETAQAHFGLAQVAELQGQSASARQQGTQALRILEAIGHREASQVRSWLARLEPET